ncbi:unnamed protein product [Rhodiola kirilowii]
MLNLNIDYSHHEHSHVPSSTESATSSSSIIVNDEDSAAAIGTTNKPKQLSTLFFGILNRDHENPVPVATRNLFPAPVESSSSPALVPQWLNLSFSDSVNNQSELWSLQQQNQQQMKPAPKKSRRGPRSRSSPYRGVTFYRRTGRWESHIWDCGKQVYLGGFDTAHTAARAYDRAAIKFRGAEADINFDLQDYDQDMKQMAELSKVEFVHVLRRQSTGFSRSSSKYRGAIMQKYGRPDAGLGHALAKSFYPGMYDREVAFGRYNAREAVNNTDATAAYGRGSLTSDACNKGSDDTLDLSLGVTPTSNGGCQRGNNVVSIHGSSAYTRPRGQRHMFDSSAAPVLCLQPAPHGFTKLCTPVWQFTHPSGSGHMSQNKNPTIEKRMVIANRPPEFLDWAVQDPPSHDGSITAPMQLLSSAASSGFPTCVVPTAPTHTVASQLSRPPSSALYYNYKD